MLSVELARDQRVWIEMFDASGRMLETIASGVPAQRGTSRWVWSPQWRAGGLRSGTYFYRVRTEDGAQFGGRAVFAR